MPEIARRPFTLTPAMRDAIAVMVAAAPPPTAEQVALVIRCGLMEPEPVDRVAGAA